MAILTAHYTELDAVNDMLLAIGETPVSSLSSGLPDAALAQQILSRKSREVQMVGWGQNTLEGFELARDSQNLIPVPQNALSVKTVTARNFRKENNPPVSGHLRVSVRKSSDGTQFILWDQDNNRETWPNDPSVTVDMVILQPFDDLSPSLQSYIMKYAGHQFQKGAIASGVLSSFTQEDVLAALAIAEQEDAEMRPLNVLRDSSSIQAAIIRNNPLYGI